MQHIVIIFYNIQLNVLEEIPNDEGCSPCGIIVKVLDCGFKVREFELQSCYYIHFLANAPCESHEHLYPLQLWVK